MLRNNLHEHLLQLEWQHLQKWIWFVIHHKICVNFNARGDCVEKAITCHLQARIVRQIQGEEARVRFRQELIRISVFEESTQREGHWPLIIRWQARSSQHESNQQLFLLFRKAFHSLPKELDVLRGRIHHFVDGVTLQHVDIDISRTTHALFYLARGKNIQELLR